MTTPADFIPELSPADRLSNLTLKHAANLAEIREDPKRTSIHSETTLTLAQIKESLQITSNKEIELKPVGDGFGKLISRMAIQTNNPNIFLLHFTKVDQPSYEVTEILYYGSESEAYSRFHANFSE